MANCMTPPQVRDVEKDGSNMSPTILPEELSVERKPIWDIVLLVKGRTHPSEYANSFKWLVTLSAALTAFLDPISYTMLYPALPLLPSSLHTSQSVSNLSSTLSLFGPAIMPLYWSYLAERMGRRVVLLSSFAFFTLFSGLAAASDSIGMLIALRLLASFCSCAGTVAGAAMVADIWPSETRGVAMSVFYLGPMAGPALGPVIGGVLAEVWGWTAIQWFLTAYSGLVLLLIALLIPETLRIEHRLLLSKRRDAAQITCPGRLLRAVSEYLLDPLRALSYLRFPIISISILIASICFATVIMSATTLQEAFYNPPYNFSYIIIGVLYLPMAFGVVLGGLLSGKWSDNMIQKHAKMSSRYNEAGQSFYAPESRLKENAYLSVALLPGALLAYGWTIQYGILWVVPAIAWFIIGFSTGLMFSLVTTVLTEFVPHKSASLVALNALGRNSFAAVSGSLTAPLAGAIGNGWSYTGLGAFSLFNVLAVVLFRRYGPLWRATVDEKTGVVRVKEAYAQETKDKSSPSGSKIQERIVNAGITVVPDVNNA